MEASETFNNITYWFLLHHHIHASPHNENFLCISTLYTMKAFMFLENFEKTTVRKHTMCVKKPKSLRLLRRLSFCNHSKSNQNYKQVMIWDENHHASEEHCRCPLRTQVVATSNATRYHITEYCNKWSSRSHINSLRAWIKIKFQLQVMQIIRRQFKWQY